MATMRIKRSMAEEMRLWIQRKIRNKVTGDDEAGEGPISNVEDDDQPGKKKKRKNPDALSVCLQALLVKYLPLLLVPALEPILERLLRKVVREEVPEIIATLWASKAGGSLSMKQIRASDGRKLQLRFVTPLLDRTFTGRKVKGKQDDAIEIKLIDATNGELVSSGPESRLQLDIVALDGDFDESQHADWTPEHFERHLAKERAGKVPLLKGDLRVTLKNGMATLGELFFTDNSKWTRSDKFRLGVRVSPGHSEHICVREPISDAFSVRENRGEHYEKHEEPYSTDDVWRLKGIAKDGPHHKALTKEKIFTVEDFRRHLVMDQARLRKVFGNKMSRRQWESIVHNSSRCIPSKKIYTRYDRGSKRTIVFNSIYEILGHFINDAYVSMELLPECEKVYLNSIKFAAYREHNSFKECDEEVFLQTLPRRTNEANPVSVEPFGHIDQREDQDIRVQYSSMLVEQSDITFISEPLPDTLFPMERMLPEKSTDAGPSSRPALIFDSIPSTGDRCDASSSFPGAIQPRNSWSLNNILSYLPSNSNGSLDQCLLPDFLLEAQDTEVGLCSAIMENTATTAPISQTFFMHPDPTLRECGTSISNEPASQLTSGAEVLHGRSWSSKNFGHSLSTIVMDELFGAHRASSSRSSDHLPEASVGNDFSRFSNWNSQKALASWLKLRNALRIASLFRNASTRKRVPVVEQGWGTTPANHRVYAV